VESSTQVEQMMRLMVDMKRQVYMNTQMLQQLLDRTPTESSAADDIVEIFPLPADSMEKLSDLEEWIGSTANFKALVRLIVIVFPISYCWTGTIFVSKEFANNNFW